MRIITGKFRGRHIAVPYTFKARPTTDFAKENLFNVLRAYLDFPQTQALDLFSGTGSITLELLSRGCPRVESVERDRQHAAFIAATLRQLGVSQAECALRCTCALRYVQRYAGPGFDFIFADPPYSLPELPELPERIMSQPALLRPGGLLVLEHGANYDFSARPDFLEHRAYGSVNFSFFRREE